MFGITALLERASTQHGVVSLADLIDLGVSSKVRARLLRNGILEAVSPHVFRFNGSARSTEQRMSLACHEVGSAARRCVPNVDGVAGAALARGAVTGEAAGWLHGIDGFKPPKGRPDVISRGQFCQYRTKAGVPHGSSWMNDDAITEVRGIPVVTVEWVLFFLAAKIPGPRCRTTTEALRIRHRERFRDAVDNAIRGGHTTDARLLTFLQDIRCRGRRGVTELEAVLNERADAPTESKLERDFLRIVDDAGLPRPTCQERIEADGEFVARVDFLYPGTKTVIEVSGYRWHGTAQQMERDSLRRNDLALTGFSVMDFTYGMVNRRPNQVIQKLRRLLSDPPKPG